ncbi:MAG: S46 family peptidase [Bacteroidaceae bacterium]|nr:S46 family peptidase [Bacteroidaceae bacterium]MBQ6752106.1 S46 family peptidase [Bacteroidaceae bacterium]
MKKFVLLFVTLMTLSAHADEGMWVMGNISEKTDSILHSMGLELTAEELYSTEHPSLNNAIVQLGGFCSGVVVSNDGLMFTNHHCGFGSIQDHSTTKHDYLKYGFYAKSFEDELPNEGLYVLFHIKTVDVTDLILGSVPKDASPEQADSIVNAVSTQLMEMVDYSGKGVQSEVNPFYKGSKYFLSVYQRYDDVRLVYAPPQCLGKYGGDTDNWMWPRQTCDFSVFRIYADKNNAPAEYSKDNVPFHPQWYAHVSTQGYHDGSYAMTLGYPGSTDRYLSSYGIESTMRTENDVRYQVRGVKLDILNEAMRQSDALRIMYASKHASSSNYWKFSLGQNTALDNLKVVDEKRQLEKELMDWAAEDTVARGRYLGITDSLKVIYQRERDALYGYNLWVESFYSGSDILSFVIKNMMRAVQGGEDDFHKKVQKAYRDIDVATDKKVFLALLQNYIQHVPNPDFLPQGIQHEVDSIWNGNYQLYVDNLYANSIFARPDELEEVHDFSELMEDPMVEVALQTVATLYSMMGKVGGTGEYERLLGDGIREMNHDHEYYPDANFTMRLSYGLCKPIDFAPGTTGLKEEATNLITSPRSFLNKYDQNPDNLDFELIPQVYKWMKSGKFSKQYIDPRTGQLPLCFLTTNDITGGNSGSGMFDGKGRLIGLAFDGNWEAMSGDLKFDNALQRCIGVDIRYVLSVMDDYSHAKRLIKELTIE